MILLCVNMKNIFFKKKKKVPKSKTNLLVTGNYLHTLK